MLPRGSLLIQVPAASRQKYSILADPEAVRQADDDVDRSWWQQQLVRALRCGALVYGSHKKKKRPMLMHACTSTTGKESGVVWEHSAVHSLVGSWIRLINSSESTATHRPRLRLRSRVGRLVGEVGFLVSFSYPIVVALFIRKKTFHTDALSRQHALCYHGPWARTKVEEGVALYTNCLIPKTI